MCELLRRWRSLPARHARRKEARSHVAHLPDGLASAGAIFSTPGDTRRSTDRLLAIDNPFLSCLTGALLTASPLSRRWKYERG